MIDRLIYKCMVLLFVSTIMVAAQGLKAESPYIAGFHPLDDEPNEFSMVRATHPVLLTLKTKVFIDTSFIDFEKRQITFRRTDPLGYTLWEYHYGELSDYLSERKNFALGRDWRKASQSALSADATKSKQNVAKLQWELPVQYPSWAQRILGNEPPKLTIDGSLKLTMGFNSNSNTRADVKSNSGDFVLDEEYQFSVTGSVGRLINVNIKSSSENSFEFSENLQNFKIEYKESTPGELEDEIIQEVTAGYTGFDMPGAPLTGINEAKKGLFGIKIKSKFGPLMLTTIAATEQAESGSKTFSSNSGGGGSNAKISQFVKNKFFYLDTLYRREYIQRYGKGGNSAAKIAPHVDSLEVWINSESVSNSIKKNCAPGIAFLTEDDTTVSSDDDIRKSQSFPFYKLKQNIHYKLFADDGYIEILDSLPISENDRIAIYLRSSKNVSGEIVSKGQYRKTAKDTLRVLWELKRSGAISKASVDPSRYYLMWRNVYEMSSKTKDLTNFKLSVKLQQDADTSVKNSDQKYYGAIVGLTDDNGKPLTEYANIFNGEEGFFIIPPFDNKSKDADLPFMNPLLGMYADTVVYEYSEASRPSIYTSKFVIEGSGASKQTVFDVEYGIISGTDKVWADGVELVRDRDYVINYDMGTLELLSLKAKAATSIKADYQTMSTFVPEKKIFLGMNGQVQLPFLSDKSFISGTLLYQDVKVNDAIPRLGQEPYSKVLFDLNTTIDLEPEWMTTLVNKLPFIETSATSKVVFSAEAAHSSMNPNPDGKAYLDDFEDSKVSDQLGNGDESWYQASPPDSILKNFHDQPPAWNVFWFSPADWDKDFRIPKKNLYVFDPKATAQTQEGYISALRLHCKPAPSYAPFKNAYKNTWAGIMTPVPSSFSNKSKEQYLEFFIKDESKGKPGKLKIQMGVMREDLSLNGGPPNGTSNKEDTSFSRTDDYYAKDLDRGLDTLTDDKEFYLVPGSANTWDTLWKGDAPLGEFINDPGRDNWLEYAEKSKGNYRYKSKKQNSTYLESEDINRNGTVETATSENYFQFTIDLNDTTAPYFDKDAKIEHSFKWRKVRIPLKEALPGGYDIRSKSGDPQWDNIRMVRLIWTDFDSTHLTEEQSLSIVDMGFVGNQWESSVDSTGSKIEAMAISNKDGNSYVPPMKVAIDNATKEAEKEQSLQIIFKNLKRGHEAIVSKNTSYQKLNLTAYKNLSLLVYGKRKSGELANTYLSGGGLKFVFRFGTDSANYYEYRCKIMPEWNNNINIDLREIAKLKDSYMVHHPKDSLDYNDGTISVRAPKGQQPNLADVKWMALGVVNESYALNETDSGEIWVNEMVLSGINDIDGWAAQANLQTNWADLFDFKTGMGYHNGNYRTMQNLNKVPENSTMNANISALLHLDKFLPKDLGISLPVEGVISGSVTRPQLKSNDVLLSENGKADGITDMASDVLRMISKEKPDFSKESELYGTQMVDKKIMTSYSKTSPSKNWLSGLLADNTTTSFTYSNRISDAYQGRDTSGQHVYVATDTTDTYSGTLNYDLSPKEPPSWTKWKPVADDTGKTWLPKKLRDYEFSLLPSTFKFDLADVSYMTKNSMDTKKDLYYVNREKSFTMKHGFSFDYTPIAPLLKLNYDVTINRDLDTLVGKRKGEILDGVFKRNQNGTWDDMTIFYGEKTRTQHAGLTLDPQIVDWLTSTVNYSSTYTGTISKYQADTSNDYLNSNVGLTLTFNSSIDFANLLSKFTSSPKKGKPDSTMIVFEKGFKKIGLRTISFTYTATSGLQNNLLNSDKENFELYDFFLYQLGVRNLGDVISGEMDDKNDFGGMRNRAGNVDEAVYKNDTRSVERVYNFSTGLDLTFPFEISFNPISFKFSKRYKVTPYSSDLDTTITFPEISVDARTPALMKVGVVANMFRDLSLSSKFSYRESVRRLMQARDTSNRIELSPLIAVNGTIKKWPINISYSHRYSKELNRRTTSDTAVINGDEFTLNYEIEKNNRLSEIKLLYWTIPIKGKTTVGLKFSRENSVSNSSDRNDPTENLTLSINPFLTYIFTDNVTGTLQYTYKKNKDNNEVAKDNQFALVIDIRFR